MKPYKNIFSEFFLGILIVLMLGNKQTYKMEDGRDTMDDFYYTEALWLGIFNCRTVNELYIKLRKIVKDCKTLVEECPLLFPFLANRQLTFSNFLFNPYNQDEVTTYALLRNIYCAYKTKEFTEKFRKNPPAESYGNPPIAKFDTIEEGTMFQFLLSVGVDLPGSKYNPIGMGHYSRFFYDAFFGNYTEVKQHIDSLSKEDLQKTLEKREGCGQNSIIFAPILGRKIMNIESEAYDQLSYKTKLETRAMWKGNNENRHFDILRELLKLGADPNAHDTAGLTGMHHAVRLEGNDCYEAISILLKAGANPNLDTTIDRQRILTFILNTVGEKPEYFKCVDLLLDYNAKPESYRYAKTLRDMVELQCPLKLAVRMRETFPKRDKECERSKCNETAEKMCQACKFVYYCSPACQRWDWLYHKVTCKKKRQSKK